jgi:DNA-binding CsgD family transcriptional regulator
VIVYGLYDPANSLARLHAPRVDPEMVRRFDDWAARVPALPCIGDYAPGLVFSGTDVISPDDFTRTAFFHECWRPAGLSIAPLVTNLVSAGAASGHVASHRMPNHAPFDSGQRRLFEALAQHLVRAAAMQQRLHHLDFARQSALAGLDALKQGFMLVDAQARPILVNRAAQALLSDDGLRLDGGALSASTAGDGRALRALVAACGDQANPAPGGKLAVRRGPGRLPLDVLVTPMPQETTESLMAWPVAQRAVAMVLVSDPETEMRARIERLREQFDFTPAEATFALEIIKGDGRKAAADRLGITVGTARSHLSSIFDKTGVRHQAALVRLLLQ